MRISHRSSADSLSQSQNVSIEYSKQESDLILELVCLKIRLMFPLKMTISSL